MCYFKFVGYSARTMPAFHTTIFSKASFTGAIPMDVSHFELIWKPQSPAAPSGTTNVATLIQGYFLEITNLESVAYSYRVELVATAVTDPKRSLAGNAIVFIDTPGANNAPGVLNGAITSTSFFPSNGLVTIPAKGTALVAILPSAFGPLPGEPTPLTAPDFEVRGYVRLTLPATFRRVGDFFVFGPQSNAPVRVLLTPQNRTTYFSASGTITDQTQASLPLASGTAVNSLPPEPGRFFPGAFEIDRLATLELERLMPVPTPAMLAGMLAMVDASGDLAGFNASLKRAGVNLALEQRSARK
jgi:hypothetical protein